MLMPPCGAWPPTAHRFDQVVDEHAVAAPDPGALEAVHPGRVPAEAVLEAADPPFAAGAPLDQPAKAPLALDQLAGGTGPALSRDGNPDHAKVGQLLVDAGLAIAPVASHRPWRPAGAGDHPLTREPAAAHPAGCRPGRVVEHDPVGVVEDLGLVAELDRPAQPALADRSGVGSCRLTSRLAPSGIPPPRRVGAWSSRRRVCWMVVCSSWSTARSRPAGWGQPRARAGGRWSRLGGRRPAGPRPARRPAR
jgi:hypothetical protein